MDELTTMLLQRVRRDESTGCWLWAGPLMTTGYGRLTYKGKYGWRVHRAFYDHFVENLQPGEVICHKCDTPSCCNPEHLFKGTQQDNLADMRAKGRQVRGVNNGASKLSEADVRNIRRLLGQRVRPVQIAEQFGVSEKSIRNLRDGTTYTDIV